MAFPLPQFIQLYPTTRCNQKCSFCFNASTGNQQDLTPENGLNLLDMMVDLDILDLDIMGGEPFLLLWMPSFLHAAIKKGVMVNISSNGSFPEVMEEFRGLSPEKINIGISLEGSSAEAHNRLTNAANFEKALSSISSLVSIGLNPIVKTVVIREAIPDIQPLIDLLKRLGVSRYYLIHRDLYSANRKDKEEALSFPEFMSFFLTLKKQNPDFEINKVNASCFEKETLPKGMRCAGGVRKLSVMPEGSVYPCNLLQHFSEFRLGNIFSGSFNEIWQNSKLALFRTFEKNRCGMPACENHESCTGGCPAHALFHGQNTNSTDIRCKMDCT